ncbi:MAG TPA: LysR substrate-binding domain-containing protein [Steroidobacter sp.]
MRKRIPALSSLRAFEAAARLGSFKQAADELSVTATAISHRIRALETELGCLLFVRKTRAIELTTAGQSLYTAVRDGFDTIAASVDRLRQHARPTVRLSTTPAFAAKWLVPRLADFQRAHPHIDLHVHASYEPIDLNLGTIDLAIRYGQGRYEDMHATLLLQDRFAPVASPALQVTTTQALLQRTLIHFDWGRPTSLDVTWSTWARAAGLPQLDVGAGIRFSEESHAIQAAIAGQGVALLSLVLIQEELKLGVLESHLTPVLDGYAYYVVRPLRATTTPAATTVETWLLAQAAA